MLSKLVDIPIVQESTPGHLDSGSVTEVFSNLQLWRLVTLQPFDIQRPTVPILEGSKPPYHTYCQFRGLAGFLIQFFPIQSSPIYYIKWALLKLNRYALYTTFKLGSYEPINQDILEVINFDVCSKCPLSCFQIWSLKDKGVVGHLICAMPS